MLVLDRPEDRTSPAPKKLEGKEFEKLLMEAAARGKDRLTMGRYGTEVRWIRGEQTPVDSLPDFEGVFDDGRQFIVETKACSQASFGFNEKFLDRQLPHLLKRAPYGVTCLLVIHFNRRELSKSVVEAVTLALPVTPLNQFWQDVKSGKIKSVTPAAALEHGRAIRWTVPKGCLKALPAFI